MWRDDGSGLSVWPRFCYSLLVGIELYYHICSMYVGFQILILGVTSVDRWQMFYIFGKCLVLLSGV